MSDDRSGPGDWLSGDVRTDDGVRIHYARTGGDGPPLVIAHGITDSALCRAPLVRDLQADYDVVAYDTRGHGESDAPEDAYALDDRVADLLAVVEGLSLDRPVLFGHSLGGSTVAAAAARRPDLPRAVVLEDPAGMLGLDGGNGRAASRRASEEGRAASRRASEEGRATRIRSARERIERWNASTTAELLESEDALAEYVADGGRALAEALATARRQVSPNIVAIYREGMGDFEELFPRITAPTLVLRADIDEAERRRDRELADLLADGRLVHVEDAGHTIFRDEYDAACRELRAFLDGRE